MNCYNTRMWLPVVSALFGIVAFLPFNLYPATFIFLVPLFIFFLREKKLWRLVLGAAFFRLLFGIGTAYYTLEPIFWLSSLLIFLGLPISIFLFKKLSRWGSQTSPTFLGKSDFPTIVFLPFAWTFFDLLQAQWSLIPTYLITAGNALGSSPFLGLAGIGGFISLTFFVALVNAFIVAIILWESNRHTVCVLLVATALFIFSGWQISQFELRRNAEAYAALPQEISFATVSVNGTASADQFEQIKQELSGRQIDLTVFPENIFNDHVGRGTSNSAFSNLAKELNTSVIAAYATASGVEKYNSAVLFGTDGAVAGVHHKNRLSFVGEYWPFGNWRPFFYEWLREKNPAIGTYAVFDPANAITPGEQNLLSMPIGESIVPFAAPICIEIHYPGDLAAYRALGARFIVNQSSNRWIGIGRTHFLYLSANLKKIESVSLQLPIIVSGVYDASGVILPSGQVEQARPTADKKYSVFFGTLKY